MHYTDVSCRTLVPVSSEMELIFLLSIVRHSLKVERIKIIALAFLHMVDLPNWKSFLPILEMGLA